MPNRLFSVIAGSKLRLGSVTNPKNNTNHRLDLDFNAKSRSRLVEHQVIQLLNFAFLPA